jgi:hypothetical protein
VSGGQERSGRNALDQLVGAGSTPELAAMVIEQYRWLCASLGDGALRQVLDFRLEG